MSETKTDDAKLAKCNCGGKGWNECPACRGGMETIFAKCSTCKGEGSFPCTCAAALSLEIAGDILAAMSSGNVTAVQIANAIKPRLATLLSHLAAAQEQPQYVKCSGCGCGILKAASKPGTRGPICIDPATCVSQQRTVDALLDCRTDDGCGECLKCLKAELAAARQQLDTVSGALADAGDVTTAVENVRTVVKQRDEARQALAASQSRAERAEQDRDAALRQCSELAKQAGLAQGELMASEMAGNLREWKERAERAEGELVAAMWKPINDRRQLLIWRKAHSRDLTTTELEELEHWQTVASLLQNTLAPLPKALQEPSR